MTQIPIPNGNYQLFVLLNAWQTFGLNDWNICQVLQKLSTLCSNQTLYEDKFWQIFDRVYKAYTEQNGLDQDYRGRGHFWII